MECRSVGSYAWDQELQSGYARGRKKTQQNIQVQKYRRRNVRKKKNFKLKNVRRSCLSELKIIQIYEAVKQLERKQNEKEL